MITAVPKTDATNGRPLGNNPLSEICLKQRKWTARSAGPFLCPTKKEIKSKASFFRGISFGFCHRSAHAIRYFAHVHGIGGEFRGLYKIEFLVILINFTSSDNDDCPVFAAQCRKRPHHMMLHHTLHGA